jgi:predicted nucleotidyltransferase
MVTANRIKQVAEQIGKKADADAVILFGSHAKGQAGENSDVDFLVIADSDQPRFKRSRELYGLFRPYPFAMDIVVYTPDEVEQQCGSPLSFVSTVLREGKRLYERTN